MTGEDKEVIEEITLKQLREHRGLTIKQVADQCGITETLLSEWEDGKTKPIGSGAGSLANALNVEVFKIIKILKL